MTFANRFGRLLRERYPDRDYYVSIMSYGPLRPAPVKAKPADNVANFIIRPGYLERDSLRDDPRIGDLHGQKSENCIPCHIPI